jgi:hypothetical protein
MEKVGCWKFKASFFLLKEFGQPASGYVPGFYFISPKKRQSPMEIRPLGYKKHYYSWESGCLKKSWDLSLELGFHFRFNQLLAWVQTHGVKKYGHIGHPITVGTCKSGLSVKFFVLIRRFRSIRWQDWIQTYKSGPTVKQPLVLSQCNTMVKISGINIIW